VLHALRSPCTQFFHLRAAAHPLRRAEVAPLALLNAAPIARLAVLQARPISRTLRASGPLRQVLDRRCHASRALGGKARAPS